MIASFARQSVIRQRGTATTDRYGNTVTDWSDPDEAPISPVTLQPVRSSITFDAQGGRQVSRYSLHTDTTADIIDGDRIKVGTLVYDIDGSVGEYASPTGRLAHLEMTLKLVK